MPFIKDSIEPGNTVHTDGWGGYKSVKDKKTAAELMPRDHRVASLVKRSLTGAHQGAVTQERLHYYLDGFAFRFNRRRIGRQAEALLPPHTASRHNWPRALQVPDPALVAR